MVQREVTAKENRGLCMAKGTRDKHSEALRDLDKGLTIRGGNWTHFLQRGTQKKGFWGCAVAAKIRTAAALLSACWNLEAITFHSRGSGNHFVLSLLITFVICISLQAHWLSQSIHFCSFPPGWREERNTNRFLQKKQTNPWLGKSVSTVAVQRINV